MAGGIKWSEVGVNPTLSRNCIETQRFLSQVASFDIEVSDLGGRSGL